MNTETESKLKYQLIDPFFRKNVDLRKHEEEIASVVRRFPTVVLDKVKKDYYQIHLLTHIKKNRVVRDLGRKLANETTLKYYSRPKKGSKSHELFIQIKAKKHANA